MRASGLATLTLPFVDWYSTLPRPRRFARYIASSASRSTSAAWATSRAIATPTLALTKIVSPSTSKGCSRMSTTRCTAACASLVGVHVVDQTTNSSPPRRPTVSEAAQLRPQPPRDLDEQLVAGIVTEAVVDELEAIEVEEDDRNRRVTAW